MPWSTRRKRSSVQNDRSLDQGSQISSQNASKNLDDGSILDSSPLQQDFQLESTPKHSGESLSQNLEPTQKVCNSQPLLEDNSNDLVGPTQIVDSTQITAFITSPLSSQGSPDIPPTQLVPSSQAPEIIPSPLSPEEDTFFIFPTQMVNNGSPVREANQEQDQEDEYLVSTQLPPGANSPVKQTLFSPDEEDVSVAPSQDVDACVHSISPKKRRKISSPSDTEDNDRSVEIVTSSALLLHKTTGSTMDALQLQCGICLEEIKELGEMDSGCGHTFCFPCILEWSRGMTIIGPLITTSHQLVCHV